MAGSSDERKTALGVVEDKLKSCEMLVINRADEGLALAHETESEQVVAICKLNTKNAWNLKKAHAFFQ